MQLLLGKTASAVHTHTAGIQHATTLHPRPFVPRIPSIPHFHPSARSIPSISTRQSTSTTTIICGAAATKVEKLTVQPVRVVEGHVKLPGSKSLSNRILLLAALAQGTTTVENILVRPLPPPLIIFIFRLPSASPSLTHAPKN